MLRRDSNSATGEGSRLTVMGIRRHSEGKEGRSEGCPIAEHSVAVDDVMARQCRRALHARPTGRPPRRVHLGASCGPVRRRPIPSRAAGNRWPVPVWVPGATATRPPTCLALPSGRGPCLRPSRTAVGPWRGTRRALCVFRGVAVCLYVLLDRRPGIEHTPTGNDTLRHAHAEKRP